MDSWQYILICEVLVSSCHNQEFIFTFVLVKNRGDSIYSDLVTVLQLDSYKMSEKILTISLDHMLQF